MKLTIRRYENESDMDLQYDFWRKVTSDLPYAWKPTLSPKKFRQQNEFDPETRCFAFDGDKLVGHMGFTGEGSFVSLGYPWVLEGYEGALQEEMFERIYHYAISPEYGANMFAQRFRSQWTTQIEFFKSKGFEVTGRSPIFGRDISKVPVPVTKGIELKIESGFDIDTFVCTAQKLPGTTEQDLSFYRTYYASVDFDFTVLCVKEADVIGCFGVTHRKDTGYAEVIASSLAEGDSHLFEGVISTIINELYERNAGSISIYEAAAPTTKHLTNLGFQKVTEDIMMMKKVD
ncbi:hypothetical protein ACSVDE_15710 [Pseudalkalibacillus sp. Hm43]|uniref:hypothetical protein n=1 Tax=Pseudalkalibacillus sp. Hm43 TaxID=3450742 RepID=UPI003F43AA45